MSEQHEISCSVLKFNFKVSLYNNMPDGVLANLVEIMLSSDIGISHDPINT